MKQTLTLACKLQPTPKQTAKIEATLKAFADACNYANQTVKPSILNGRTIQELVYDSLREQFGLSANLAVRACARVGANRKTAKVKDKLVKSFKPTSADYDARIFAFSEFECSDRANLKAWHPQTAGLSTKLVTGFCVLFKSAINCQEGRDGFQTTSILIQMCVYR